MKKLIQILTILLTILLIFYIVYEDKEKDPKNSRIRSENDAEKFLKEFLVNNNVAEGSGSFHVLEKETDKLGISHYTLRQKINKVFSEDIEIKIHVNKKGNILLVNGNIDDIKNNKRKIENTIKISSEIALEKAISFIGLHNREYSNGSKEVFRSNNLVIQNNKYIYKMEINTIEPLLGHWVINVDAETGNVLNKDQIDRISIKKDSASEVRVISKKNKSNSKIQHIYCYEKNNNECINFSKTKEAEILRNINSTIRYFKDTHNRKSFDDKNSIVMSIINVDLFNGKTMKNNAGWIGDKFIFGLSDGKVFTDLYTSKDIIAHEFTHAVTQFTATLEYEHESGALNESFSDVFAYFIDHENWLIGEDAFLSKRKENALRSLSDPEEYGQPSHYKDYIYIDGDNGGIHINSGIPNKAAYRTIEKIGIEKSQQIYYRALTLYLSKHSNFKDAKTSLVQSAKDLYGNDVAIKVKKSWVQTGIK